MRLKRGIHSLSEFCSVAAVDSETSVSPQEEKKKKGGEVPRVHSAFPVWDVTFHMADFTCEDYFVGPWAVGVFIFCEVWLVPAPPPAPRSPPAAPQLLHPRRRIAKFAAPHKHTFWGLVLINCVMLLSNTLCLMTVDADSWNGKHVWDRPGGRPWGPGGRPGLQRAPSPLPAGASVLPSPCPAPADPIVLPPPLRDGTSLKRRFRIHSVGGMVVVAGLSGLWEYSAFDLLSSFRNVGFSHLFSFFLPFPLFFSSLCA